MTSVVSGIRRRLRAEDGTAAVEFALIMPLLVTAFFGTVELADRFSIRWDAATYNHQVGDFLSRSSRLTYADLEDVYAIRDETMQYLDIDDANVSMRFVSIGYDINDKPLVLWDHEIGPEILDYDLDDAIGLATHGQSALLVVTRIDATSRFSHFGGPRIEMTKSAFFRPRTTRAIAFDGSLTEGDRHERGYTDTDQPVTGEEETGDSA